MGSVYNIPKISPSHNEPADFTWKTSLSYDETLYFNDVFGAMIPTAQGHGTDDYDYDVRVGSTTNTDYIGFLIRSSTKYSLGQNYHSSSTHIHLSKRTKNGVTEYSKAAVQTTSGVIISSWQDGIVILPSYVNAYTSYDDLYNALSGIVLYPITYRLTNCTAPTAPAEAATGDTINVSFTFPDGYGFPNPATDVYVYNNGVLVPSSYANNTLTFTMPDPS